MSLKHYFYNCILFFFFFQSLGLYFLPVHGYRLSPYKKARVSASPIARRGRVWPEAIAAPHHAGNILSERVLEGADDGSEFDAVALALGRFGALFGMGGAGRIAQLFKPAPVLVESASDVAQVGRIEGGLVGIDGLESVAQGLGPKGDLQEFGGFGTA